jgi:hypothetical protein
MGNAILNTIAYYKTLNRLMQFFKKRILHTSLHQQAIGSHVHPVPHRQDWHHQQR